MKTTVISVILSVFILVLSPIILIKDKAVSAAAPVLNMTVKSDKTFKIKTDKKIEEISAYDYVLGVLCKEMPPTYDKEALKAQAVAIYTFALKRQEEAKSEGRSYDLTSSPLTDQCYADINEEKKKWGENADKYYKVYESAVKEVYGEYLQYDGHPALTVYHAISPGATNNARDVWGKALPYLVTVNSIGDKLSPEYLSEKDIGEQEVIEKLKEICEIAPGKNGFGKLTTLNNGFVISADINGKTVSGREIAEALSLKSAAFEVEYNSGNYHFTVKGKGHGVGMSQVGALYLAKQGSTYKEILSHYYKGLEIKKA